MPHHFRPLALLLLIVFALPGEGVLRAQVLEKLPLPNLSTPALNLMRLDRLMAPGLTVGAESSLERSGGYHMGYVQATIPLKGKLAIGLDLGEVLDIKKPLDALDVLKPDIRQRFIDVGARGGYLLDRGLDNLPVWELYAGASGLRYLGNRGFLIWGLRGSVAESTRLFGESAPMPRIGIRAQSALGYARFAKPGMLWYAGAYLAYDDGMWVPLPWLGVQARHPRGHRFRILLPRELQYRYRFGKKSFLHAARWELGAQANLRMERYGSGNTHLLWGPYDTRSNTTLWEGRVGAWVGHRFHKSRIWLQVHGGWVPYRRWATTAAPGSDRYEDPASMPLGSAYNTEWVWDAFALESQNWGLGPRPYMEIKLIADLGKDWLGLDLGRVLMP